MIVLPQPSCHNRLKSLNSFSVSLLQIAAYLASNVSVKDCHLCLQQPPLELGRIPHLNRGARVDEDHEYLFSSRSYEVVGPFWCRKQMFARFGGRVRI